MLMSALKPLGELENNTEFAARHIGPYEDDERHMLGVIGAAPAQRRALIEAIVPRAIARSQPMDLPAAGDGSAGAGRAEGAGLARTGC